MNAEVDIKAALAAHVAALREQRRNPKPPPPLLVPPHVFAIAEVELGSKEAAHEHIDAEARRYGFDGYELYALR